MYSVFKKSVNKLLEDRKITINFVDIGSRNGVLELDGIAAHVAAYGFEPNPVEYEKLVSGKTDAARLGVVVPSYSMLTYAPYAIAGTAGIGDFYVTHGPGAAGMLEPDPTRLKEIRWKGELYKDNLADDVFKVDKVIQVETNTLGSFAKEKKLAFIDYLKIDVEGSEYEVLESAGDLLKNVGVIKVEICFITFRKNQKLFSEVDLLLRKFGFDLLRYESVPEQVGLKERTEPWSYHPAVGVPEKYGQLIQADALYVNRSLANNSRRIAQAVVLIDKNYLDEALFVLRTRTDVKDSELFEMLRTFPGDAKTLWIKAIFGLVRRLVRGVRKFKRVFSR